MSINQKRYLFLSSIYCTYFKIKLLLYKLKPMAKDIFHNNVKEALIKDGWTITHDPLRLLKREEGGLETDLGAEKLIVAEKGLTKIAVEVKSFQNPSPINDFHTAFGQYQTYIDVIT